MLSKKSKIERRQKSRKCLFLDYSAVVMLFSVDTTVRGRFSEKRCGPSRRCARNASAALENFVCYPQKTFSTASTQTGSRCFGDFTLNRTRSNIRRRSRRDLEG